MTTRLYDGHLSWSMARDSEGHREYKIVYLVHADYTDGPANVLNTPGLPVVGSFWNVDGDSDPWAWCRPDAKVAHKSGGKEGEKQHEWAVEFTFSTKPPDDKKQRCHDAKIEDPILEPPKVSGSFTKYTEEATIDRFSKPVTNSAHEQIRGSTVEFDASRPSIKIEQNVVSLGIEVFSKMVDTLNDRPLWGLPKRKVKLSNVSWERKYHGLCYKYYTRSLEFDIRYDGWERDILDEGTKVLSGRWDEGTGLWTLVNVGGEVPKRQNPQHFIRFQDRQGNNARVILDGMGKPFTPQLDTKITDCIQCGAAFGFAPKYWRVTGTDHQFETGDELLLTHVSNCTWDGVGGDGNLYTLSVIQDDPTYGSSFQLQKGVGARWLYDLRTWKCLGPNTLYGVERDALNQESDEVTLTWGAKPGNIHIEKYGESNFLLLGIPTSI